MKRMLLLSVISCTLMFLMCFAAPSYAWKSEWKNAEVTNLDCLRVSMEFIKDSEIVSHSDYTYTNDCTFPINIMMFETTRADDGDITWSESTLLSPGKFYTMSGQPAHDYFIRGCADPTRPYAYKKILGDNGYRSRGVIDITAECR